MRSEFCTLFDRHYLPRGLVLYRSLARLGLDFGLRVFCMDSTTVDVLAKMALPGLDPVSLGELEEFDRDLLAVKPSRSQVEYCWTATPSVCLAALAREPHLEGITYLDADLAFHGDPGLLFDEIGDRSTAIVPHRYAPQWRHFEEVSGVYNVEWVTFRRDADGLEALTWWRERCLEWCYARFEDGKYGDQKYLDDWPTRFQGVHVLEHPGGGLAPWNVEMVELWRDPAKDSVMVDDVPLVFFHHHGLRLIGGSEVVRRVGALAGAYGVTPRPGGGKLVWRSSYPIAGPQRELLWEPYLRGLATAYEDIRRVDPEFDDGFTAPAPREIVRVARTRARRAPARLRASLASRRARLDWSDEQVAGQMVRLADEELQLETPVAPFRVFVAAMRDLVATGELPKSCPFLDLGCGVGGYGDMLEREFPGVCLYEGWDASPAVIEAARRRRSERPFRVASLLEDEIPARFEIVLASALLDVMLEFERALDLLLASPAPHILLHRQRITWDRTHVDRAPGYIGQTTYRSYVTYADLESAAVRNCRRIARTYHVEGDVHTFLLERVDDRG